MSQQFSRNHEPFSSFNAALEQLGLGRVVSAKPMIGGDINRAFKLELNGGGDGAADTVFLKANSRQNADFFRAEVAGLNAIASLGILQTPRVLTRGGTIRCVGPAPFCCWNSFRQRPSRTTTGRNSGGIWPGSIWRIAAT